jgi:hypothetical protein
LPVTLIRSVRTDAAAVDDDAADPAEDEDEGEDDVPAVDDAAAPAVDAEAEDVDDPPDDDALPPQAASTSTSPATAPVGATPRTAHPRRCSTGAARRAPVTGRGGATCSSGRRGRMGEV